MYKEKLDYISKHTTHLSDAEKKDVRASKSACGMGRKLTHSQHSKIFSLYTRIQKIEG